MRTVALRARRVYATLPGPPLDDAVVVLADGVVRDVLSSAHEPPGAEIIDLGQSVIVPGFIDAHVHLALTAGNDALAAMLDVADADVTARMVANAGTLLASGVTTARDLGAPTLPALAARAVLAGSGQLRLLVAGAPITAVGAHLHFFGGAVPSAREAADLVDQQAGAGVDWIKLVLSGGQITPGSNPRDPGLPADVAGAAVTAAHGLGLPVAAHCHTVAAARLAISLGIETVEHCSLLDAAPLDVVAPGVVCPTANARWLAATDAESQQRGERLSALRNAGSTLIAGTDAGIPGVGFGAYADGLLALHRAGVPPEEVMAAATSVAAAALGLTDRGVLQPGAAGDLVALTADPFDDLTALRNPVAVFVAGRRVAGCPVSGR